MDENLNQQNTPSVSTNETSTNSGATSQANGATQNTPSANGVEINIPQGQANQQLNQQASQIADFDYSAYESELIQTGELSSKSMGELYKMFPKNLVDNYLANMQHAAQYAFSQTQAEAYNAVGGEDTYKNMVGWATNNLSAEEIKAYNDAVNGKDRTSAMQAIKGLHARFSLANGGKKPSIMLGGAATGGGNGDVFFSRQDYANAVGDPQYEKSPQFRAEVQAKLARTMRQGGYQG